MNVRIRLLFLATTLQLFLRDGFSQEPPRLDSRKQIQQLLQSFDLESPEECINPPYDPPNPYKGEPSPIRDYADVFVREGRATGVDPRWTVEKARWESQLGTCHQVKQGKFNILNVGEKPGGVGDYRGYEDNIHAAACWDAVNAMITATTKQHFSFNLLEDNLTRYVQGHHLDELRTDKQRQDADKLLRLYSAQFRHDFHENLADIPMDLGSESTSRWCTDTWVHGIPVHRLARSKDNTRRPLQLPGYTSGVVPTPSAVLVERLKRLVNTSLNGVEPTYEGTDALLVAPAFPRNEVEMLPTLPSEVFTLSPNKIAWSTAIIGRAYSAALRLCPLTNEKVSLVLTPSDHDSRSNSSLCVSQAPHARGVCTTVNRGIVKIGSLILAGSERCISIQQITKPNTVGSLSLSYVLKGSDDRGESTKSLLIVDFSNVTKADRWHRVGHFLRRLGIHHGNADAYQ